MNAQKMELSGYLEARLRPISSEMADSGARHVIACYVPIAGHMKLLTDLPPAETAEMLRRMGAALINQAEDISRGLSATLLVGPPSGEA